MKKIIIFLLFLFLNLNVIYQAAFAAPPTNTFNEGIYNSSNLGLQQNKIYSVQNTSSNEAVYVILFNDHQEMIQYMKLLPNSAKQNLLPMSPNYRIIIIGNGDVYLS